MTRTMARTFLAALFAVMLAGASAADPISKSDEKLLNDMAQANAVAVVAAKFAADNAQDSDVKAFGRLLAEDHAKALTKITEIGRQRQFDVNAKRGVTNKGKELLLEHRGETKFDEAYVESQLAAHEDVIRLLNAAINEGQDAGVKQLASQLLPDIRHHLEMAKQLHARLAVSAALQ